MDPNLRYAIVANIAERLEDVGSWSGETHLQKTTFLVQELAGVPLGYDFVLYHYGPFSFDFRDEMAQLRRVGFLEMKLNPAPYGPSYKVSEGARAHRIHLQKSIARYSRAIELVVEFVGSSMVSSLERLSTAYWVTREAPGDSVGARAARVRALKPHIAQSDAVEALRRVDELSRDLAAG